MKSPILELEERGILHSLSDRAGLEKAFNDSPITFYCGFDPTADSLHVGSLLPLILMRRLAKMGHRPIALMGSGTGMIGDPSGKSAERNLQTLEQVELNLKGIRPQVQKVIGGECEIVSNADWLTKISMIDFLRDVGKHFSVNAMLQRDSVKTRLETRDDGISYTEFSYMLLQAYDFLWLYENKKCILQVGGSDQWGNIVSGADLVRRKHPQKQPAFALTNHLLMTSSGAKFGKTAAGAVWLDGKKTTPYQFYQFWLNSDDADIGQYLKFFSELPIEETNELLREHQAKPELRTAQKKLAEELTILLHGHEALSEALGAAQALFGGDLTKLDLSALEEAFKSAPCSSVELTSLEKGIAIADLLVLSGASKSKGEARRLIDGGGVNLNSQKISSSDFVVTTLNLLHSTVLVIRTGKKNYFLVRAQ